MKINGLLEKVFFPPLKHLHAPTFIMYIYFFLPLFKIVLLIYIRIKGIEANKPFIS